MLDLFLHYLFDTYLLPFDLLLNFAGERNLLVDLDLSQTQGRSHRLADSSLLEVLVTHSLSLIIEGTIALEGELVQKILTFLGSRFSVAIHYD